jgi:hypothetical protein
VGEDALVAPSGGSGRCLCGAVSFTVRGPLRDVLDCHCHRCRRFTGHHMAATSLARSDLVVRDPEAQLRWYHPVEDAGYGFCGRCGSSLFWQGGDTPDTVSVCAGVLDPPTGLRTVAAWWVGEASDYFERPALPEHLTEP